MPHFILASGSPRRSDLLKQAGMSFDIIPSPAEEVHDSSIPLRELCEHNAQAKAAEIASLYPDSVVLGADTLVYIDNQPLGKPKSKEEAAKMLAQLSGRTHYVCTGVCIIQGDNIVPFSEVTEVTFQSVSPETIIHYMSLVNVMDKAGSYALQEHGEILVKSVIGDPTNVIGLPMQLTLDQLANFGLQPEN